MQTVLVDESRHPAGNALNEQQLLTQQLGRPDALASHPAPPPFAPARLRAHGRAIHASASSAPAHPGRRQRYSMSAPSVARLYDRTRAGLRATPREWLARYPSTPGVAHRQSHKPGDHSNTVSPASFTRRQWPARAMVSMVSNTSVCSCRSRCTSARLRSQDCGQHAGFQSRWHRAK